MIARFRPLSRRQHKGFTLIEVVIALAVIAISLAAVINGVGKNVSNAAYLRDKTLAHWVALNKVAEIQLIETELEVSDKSGKSELAERNWEWSVNISNTEIETIKRLVVKVRPEDEEGDLATVTAYVAEATP